MLLCWGTVRLSLRYTSKTIRYSHSSHNSNTILCLRGLPYMSLIAAPLQSKLHWMDPVFHLRYFWCRTMPHPVLRSVTRRQFVESSPTRPFLTTLHSKGRNSGEMRCSATSGDMLFILSTLRSLWRYSNTLRKCFHVIYPIRILQSKSMHLCWTFKGREPHHVGGSIIFICHFLVSWKLLYARQNRFPILKFWLSGASHVYLPPYSWTFY